MAEGLGTIVSTIWRVNCSTHSSYVYHSMKTSDFLLRVSPEWLYCSNPLEQHWWQLNSIVQLLLVVQTDSCTLKASW